MKLMCATCNLFEIKFYVMMVWWPKLVAIKLNNRILLCLTETYMFIIVFQFYNTTGCPLQKKNTPYTAYLILLR
jgi:hypothetical protein